MSIDPSLVGTVFEPGFQRPLGARLLFGWRKYSAVMLLHVQERMQYGLEMSWSAMYTVLSVVVFSFLWRAMFRTQGVEVLMGFTFEQMVWYVLIGQIVSSSGVKRMVEDISDDVKSGSIAYALNRPYSYILFMYARQIGTACCRWVFQITLAGAAALLIVGDVAPWWVIVPTMVAIFLGATIDFLITAGLGLLSFWLEDTVALSWIYRKIAYTIGGLFVPLEVFPRVVGTVLSFLPFASILYGPSRLFVHFSWGLFARTIAGQIVWIIIISAIITWEFRVMSSKISIAGG